MSKTDNKGLIRYVNQTFIRVSAYAEEQLVGQPHNLVRHPEMPRCVFQLMWDKISAGEEIFAYVQNLAADGAHYWVFAHVTPSFGAGHAITGYHSTRRSPDRAALGPVTDLYRRLCAEESRHAQPADAIAASAALLCSTLAAQNQTYDEWVWRATPSLSRSSL